MKRILIFDTDYSFGKQISDWLRNDGFETRYSDNLLQAKKHISEKSFDILIAGIRYKECDGMKLLQWIKNNGISIPFLFALDVDNNSLMASGYRHGAHEYLDKRSLKQASLLGIIREVYARNYPKRPDYQYKSEAYQDCIRKANIASVNNGVVLIVGESGCGKSHIAKRIHLNSKRSSHLFVPIKCGLLDETRAIEMLLGGYDGKSSKASPGILTGAGSGTLFFDEIDKLPLNAQMILVHIIEEGEYHPTGRGLTKTFNARMIVSTSSNLIECVTSGTFRRDLYDLICHNVINVPPLRMCKEDIIPLAEYFLREYSQEIGSHTKGLSKSAKQHLLSHEWQGNIRELRSVLKLAESECDSHLIKSKHLHLKKSRPQNNHDNEQTVIEALTSAGYNKTLASKLLGISRPTLYSMITKYKLQIR